MKEAFDIIAYWVGVACLFLIALAVYEAIFNWVEVKVRSLASRLFAPERKHQE